MSAAQEKNVALVYFDAGGGHRAAALALQEAIRRQQRPWRVQLVNLQQLLAPIDIARRLFGLNLEELYNALVRRGWTLGAAQLLKLLHVLIRLSLRRQIRLLADYWREFRPDLVVSLVPNFNRAIFASLQLALPGTPGVIVLTDIADYPPHFWLEPPAALQRALRLATEDQPLARLPAVVCGSELACRQAAEIGLPANAIHRVSGMMMHPSLYSSMPQRNADAEPAAPSPQQSALPACLVLFGGMGSGLMLSIARRVERERLPLQLILVCGHNQALERRLSRFAARARTPMRILGFSREIPQWMADSDFMLGKPGPGSISEAIAMRLPLIVLSNAATLPQERYNAEWLQACGAGMAIHSLRELAPALRRMLDPLERARFRQAAAAMENNAVWEIPEIMNGLLSPPDSMNASTSISFALGRESGV